MTTPALTDIESEIARLSPEAQLGLLERLVQRARVTASVFILLRAQTGHDFSQDKPATIHRRIERHWKNERDSQPARRLTPKRFACRSGMFAGMFGASEKT